jgi:hypothetical protein
VLQDVASSERVFHDTSLDEEKAEVEQGFVRVLESSEQEHLIDDQLQVIRQQLPELSYSPGRLLHSF